MPVIVGEVIEKDGRYLLVQEARKSRGKWCLPASHLDIGETLLDEDEIYITLRDYKILKYILDEENV